MFITLTMMMVSWVFAYVESPQILYIKYVQFLFINYILIKVLKYIFYCDPGVLHI